MNKRPLLILFLVLFLSVNCELRTMNCYAQEMSKEEESLFVAKKAFEDGFYEVSLGLLERFLKNYPDSPRGLEARLLTGECYFHQARFLDALDEFESLLKQPAAKDIRDACFYWIAEVHFKANNFSKAAEYYQKVIDNFPQSSYSVSAYYSLGWCLFQESKFDEAMRYFSIVEERFPKEPLASDASFKIIECLYNLKDYSALAHRLKTYLKAYSKDSAKLAYLYFYLGEAYYYLNDFSAAAGQYAKAISAKGEDKMQALSRLGLGWADLKLKNYKEAKDLFSEIKSDSLEKPSRDILFLGKAVLSFETANYEESRVIYTELLNTTQDDMVKLQAYLGEADCLYNLSMYGDAISIYKKAASFITSGTPPEMTDKLHYGSAWAYLKEGEFKSAIEEFQKIARLSEDKVIKVAALCQVGDTYQDSGDYQKASDTYDSILKDYPDSFYSDYVQYQLGLTLLKVSKYDGAILAFKKLIDSSPDSKLRDDAAYSLGLAYFQKEDYNASFEVFQRFNTEFKESASRPQAVYLLGTSLYNLGKYAQAIEVFKNVIRQFGADTELTQKAEYEIADCFYQMGDEKEAMSRFKSLRAKYPDSSLTAEVVWWLGEYYYRTSQTTLARRYFSSLTQDFPKSNLVTDAYYALGTIAEDESNLSEAMDNFRKVIELGKTELAGTAAVAIGDIYVKLEQFDSALKTYKETVQANTQLAGLVYPKLGDTYRMMNDYGEAINFYRQSLDLVPVGQASGIQFKIAEVLQAEGKKSEAVGEYLKVTYLYAETNTLTVKALLRVGSIYEELANYKEAANIYRKVVSMNVEEGKYAKERLDLIRQAKF